MRKETNYDKRLKLESTRKKTRAVFAELMGGKIEIRFEDLFRLVQRAKAAAAEMNEFLPQERLIKLNQLADDLDLLYTHAIRNEIDQLREDIGYDRRSDNGDAGSVGIDGKTGDTGSEESNGS